VTDLTAVTPPTVDNVAEMLTGGDGDFHDGNDWHPSLSAADGVVHIGITPLAEDGTQLAEVHFEAHVFAAEPPAPVAADPVTLTGDLARDLANGTAVGDELDSWTVVANTLDYTSRWDSHHTLIIRNAVGEHFAGDYTRGLTEQQDYGAWEYDTHATFRPVERRTRVVQSVEWVTPAADLAEQEAGR
jgi:hypothetical protein